MAHKLEDRELLEYTARKMAGKRIGFEENHKRLDGLVERFQKPEITVLDCAQIPRDEAKWLVENRPVKDWLSALVDGGGQGEQLANGYRAAQSRPLQIVVCVNPEMWELSVRAFLELGYTVTNADAPWTPIQELWSGRGEEVPVAPPPTRRKSCEDCAKCITQDHGYSNWTVEGTYIHCAANVHPESGFDRFYGEDSRLFFAETCPSFERGDSGIGLDVEGEELSRLTPEQLEIVSGCNSLRPAKAVA